jgi:hypothetical protein
MPSLLINAIAATAITIKIVAIITLVFNYNAITTNL